MAGQGEAAPRPLVSRSIPGRQPAATLDAHTSSSKRITLWENQSCPAMCPVLHYAAIFVADNAFHPELVASGLTVHKLHDFTCPNDRITVTFNFREDILKVPVFRRNRRTLMGPEVDPTRALTARFLNTACRRLGTNSGFELPFTPYALRREGGTEMTGALAC